MICLSDDFYHHFIDRETKVQTAQIIQVLKPSISESKSSVLCMDQVKNFLLEKPLNPFEQRVICGTWNRKERMVESGDHVVSIVDRCSCFLHSSQSLGVIGFNKMLMSHLVS